MKKEHITPEMFQSLSLPHKDLPEAAGSRYRVYSDAKNFVVVEADNAQDALAASGLAKAHRILRESLFRDNVLTIALAAKAEAAPKEEHATEVPAESAKPEESAAPPAAAEPAAASEPEAPLSNEDVNKLLEG